MHVDDNVFKLRFLNDEALKSNRSKEPFEVPTAKYRPVES
jgi:hypothetical protein